MLLHLVGSLHRCTSDVRPHKHQVKLIIGFWQKKKKQFVLVMLEELLYVTSTFFRIILRIRYCNYNSGLHYNRN